MSRSKRRKVKSPASTPPPDRAAPQREVPSRIVPVQLGCGDGEGVVLYRRIEGRTTPRYLIRELFD